MIMYAKSTKKKMTSEATSNKIKEEKNNIDMIDN